MCNLVFAHTCIYMYQYISCVFLGLASMTVPIYLAECAPVHLRGRLTVADNMAITAGQFVAAVIDYCFSYVPQGWRYVRVCQSILCMYKYIGSTKH